MTYQYFAIGDTKHIEGFAKDIFEAKQKIRNNMRGQKFSWQDDVTIVEVK